MSEINPITREEIFMAYAAGNTSLTLPRPITRREQFLNAIAQMVASGGATPEQIQSYVSAYLEENPVQAGATTEEAAQIEQNKKDIERLDSEMVKTINGKPPDESGNVAVDAGSVKTVNGVAPDASGNVKIVVSGGTGSGGNADLGVTGATVGQTVKISAVDENGVPTAWESVDFPSGGSGAENDNDWELINTIEFTEEGITAFTIDKDLNGNPFELSDAFLISKDMASLGGTSSGSARIKPQINGKNWNFHIGNISTSMRIFVAIAFVNNGRIYCGNTDFLNNTNVNANVPISPFGDGKNLYNDDSIKSIGIFIGDPGTEFFKVGYGFELRGRRKK